MQKVSSIKTHCNTAQCCFSSGRHHRCSIEPVWLVRTATSDWERQRRLGRLRLQSLITGAETLDRRASGGRTRGGAERSGGLTGRADRTRCDPMRFLGAMPVHASLAARLTISCMHNPHSAAVRLNVRQQTPASFVCRWRMTFVSPSTDYDEFRQSRATSALVTLNSVFAAAGLPLWINLPSYLRQDISNEQFKRQRQNTDHGASSLLA